MIVINAAAAHVFNVQGESGNVLSDSTYNVESLAAFQGNPGEITIKFHSAKSPAGNCRTLHFTLLYSPVNVAA